MFCFYEKIFLLIFFRENQKFKNDLSLNKTSINRTMPLQAGSYSILSAYSIFFISYIFISV